VIETVQDNHSYNMDELLSYLLREMESRDSLAAANIKNNDRYKREMKMSTHYRRMYEAAKFYRLNPQ